jgi:hypothetical protein
MGWQEEKGKGWGGGGVALGQDRAVSMIYRMRGEEAFRPSRGADDEEKKNMSIEGCIRKLLNE